MHVTSKLTLPLTTLLMSILLLFPPTVSSHGHVNSTVIDGTLYDGYNIDFPHHPKIFRSIGGDEPVLDLESADMQCGHTGEPASLTARVAPGARIEIGWGAWPGSHLGPITVYLAKCPGDCSVYRPGTEKVWFKLHQIGKLPPTPTSTYYNIWPTHNLTNLQPFVFRLPQNLASGNYILRHEIIALHSAQKYPGVEVYPSCFQIAVGGQGRGKPREGDLVAFPGAYGKGDAGVVYNVWAAPVGEPYRVPGPEVAGLVG